MVTLVDVEKFIHKHIKYNFIEHGNVTLTYNNHVWMLTVNNSNSMLKFSIQNMIKHLPSTIGYFEYPSNKHVFGPIESKEQQYEFYKAQSSIIGTELIHKYEEVKAIKELFADAVHKMVEHKKLLDNKQLK